MALAGAEKCAWHHFLLEHCELSWKRLLLKIKIVVEAVASQLVGELGLAIRLVGDGRHGWL